MTAMNWMRDPTAETTSVKRARLKPPPSLTGKTVGLFDIGKTRTDEFFNQVETRLHERGIKTQREEKAVDHSWRVPEISPFLVKCRLNPTSSL